MTENLLEKLSVCIERGKVDQNSPYPPDMKGEPGASELTEEALNSGLTANTILSKSLMIGMHNIGEKFSNGKAYIPDLLIAAKAMKACMLHLKPYFDSGEAKHKGTMIIGTVAGDLHDIGKNIVGMVMEGDGWKIIDLGVDTKAEKFLEALKEHPGASVGLSALLTTTMLNMEKITSKIKEEYPDTKVFIGGAPLSDDYNHKIGADGYFKDPYGLTKHLNNIANS